MSKCIRAGYEMRPGLFDGGTLNWDDTVGGYTFCSLRESRLGCAVQPSWPKALHLCVSSESDISMNFRLVS